MDGLALPRQSDRRGQEAGGQHPPVDDPVPQRLQAGHADQVGAGGERSAVERADRTADDQIGPDAGLHQRPQHPDLDGAQVAPAGHDEGDRPTTSAKAVDEGRHGAAEATQPRISLMELLLVRHALPDRVEHDDGTPADPGLSEPGRGQAEALAAFVAGERPPPAAVYTSPMRRARATAEPVAARLGVAVEVVDDLAEFDREASAYVPVEELRASGHPMWTAMTDGSYWESIDLAGFQAKVSTAVEQIIEARAGESVVVVTHGGMINVYVAGLLGIGPAVFFDPAYASVSRILASRGGRRAVGSLNETGHLRALGPRV
jgi:2,3-bisphosphoglycerate-dependent phosphoglycerate mutase